MPLDHDRCHEIERVRPILCELLRPFRTGHILHHSDQRISNPRITFLLRRLTFLPLTQIQPRLPHIVYSRRHRITNAVAEGLNSKIMSIKRRARGFRNPENFKVAIFFYCGGLDLQPHPH